MHQQANNSEIVCTTIIGKLDMTVLQAGCPTSFMLKNIQYIPRFYTKLSCLMVAMQKGCVIYAQKKAINVEKDAL